MRLVCPYNIKLLGNFQNLKIRRIKGTKIKRQNKSCFIKKK